MAKSADGEQQHVGKTLIGMARDFDFRSFVRLSGWGTAAVAALFFALATAMSGSGSQRPGGVAQGDEVPPLTPAELTARAVSSDHAIQQLSDAVRRLAAEREQTTARLAALEHSLDDVTGSIKGLASATPAPPAPQPPAIAGTGAPQSILPPTAATTSIVPQPMPRPSAAAPEASEPAPGEPAAARAVSDLNNALGVDVGGAVNFDGLRVLWNSTRDHNPALFEGLFPMVAVRESGKTHGAELRLLVGPLTGADDAGRICAALSAARRYCQPVAFEGQRLLLAEAPERPSAPVPQRKRAAAAERKSR